MTSQSILVVFILICIVGSTKSQKPDMPGAITATFYSTTIVVEWQREDGQSYIVLVSEKSPGMLRSCYGGEENAVPPFTVTNDINGSPIQPRTLYTVGVCAGSIPSPIPPNPDLQTSMSDPITLDAVETGPPPPTNLKASSFTNNEIFVEWDDSDDVSGDRAVTSYTVYFKPTTGGATESSITTADRTKSATLAGLSSNTEYNIKVVSLTSDEFRTSDRSFSITGTTVPSKPTNFYIDRIHSTSIETSWTNLEGLTYKVIAVESGVDITNCNGGEVASLQFTFTSTSEGVNITSRTAYDLAVCAVNANGGMSELAVRPGVNTGPAPPTNLKASSNHFNEIFVQWDDDDVSDVHPVTQYTVYYQPTSGGIEASESTTDRTRSITLTGLFSNTEYTISVMSITSNADKTSDRSLSIQSITVPLPSPPGNFQLDRIFSASMETSWTEEDDLTYKVVASSEEINDCNEGVTAESPFTFSRTNDGMNITSRMAYNLALCAVNTEGTVGDPSFINNAIAGPAPPTKLMTMGITTNTLSIKWDDDDVADVHPVTQYTVYYQPTSGGVEASESTTDRTRSITITGLQSNTEYTISVMSITGSPIKTSDRSSSISGITVPIQANNPVQTAVTNSSMSLRWVEAIENDALERNYTVSWIPSSNTGVSSMSVGNSTSITIDDLSSNKEYEFKLKAYNVAGSGDPSTGVAYATVPAQANDPNRINASSSSISLSWVEVEEDTALERNYTVSWTSLSSSDVSVTSTSTSTSITIDELSSNKEYEFKLTAYNVAGSGEPSHALHYATVPLQLSSPNSSDVTNASVFLQWTEIDEGPLDKTYIVACSSVDDNDVRGGDRVNGTSFQVDDLMSNSEYSCTVAAENKGGKGLPSPSTPVITFPGNPPPPTNSTTATATTISLQWEEVDKGSADKTYIVRWSSDEGVGYKPDISSTSTTIIGLNPSTSYTFSLMASNEAGNSSLSTEEIFLTVPNKTKQTNLSSVPTNPTTTLEIEWSQPDGGEEIDGYLVEWMLSSGPYVDSKDVPHNNENISYSQTIGNLTPGETYNVSVKAYNSANRGEPQIRNKTTVPEIVVGLKPSQSTTNPTTRIKLTWSTEGSGDSIQVFYNSTTTETYYGPVFLPLKNNEGEIAVEPGNNYSISVRTSSNGLLSREDESTKVKINSEPDQVVITKVTLAATTLTMYWNQPAGYIEGYSIRIIDNKGFLQESILGNTATSYQADGLSPNTDYSVSVQSWITDIEGELNYSEAPSPEQVTTISDRPSCPTTCNGCFECEATGSSCVCTCINGYYHAGGTTCKPVVCGTEALLFPSNNSIQVVFPETQAGYSTKSLTTCGNDSPNAGVPYGSRSCYLNGNWGNATWLSSCGTTLQSFENITLTTPEERLEVANDLEVLTSDPESLNAENVSSTLLVLGNIVDTTNLELETASSVVQTVGNLLQVPEDELQSSEDANKIMETLDSIGKNVELNIGEKYEEVTATVSVAVVQFDTNEILDGIGYSFNALSTPSDLGFRADQLQTFTNKPETGNVSSYVYVPEEAIKKSPDNRTSFYAFSDDSLFNSNGRKSPIGVVNSEIILTVSVVGNENVENLQNPINLFFSISQQSDMKSDTGNIKCVFWDEAAQLWSSEGGKTNASNASTQCSFDHLTSFAALFTPHSIHDTSALNWITVIGCAISIVCLVLTLLVFAFVRSTSTGKRFRSSFLLANLCLALLCLDIILIFSEQDFVISSKNGCISVAVLLHFFLLSTIAWMTIEAFNIYMAVVHVIYTRANITDRMVVTVSILWGWLMPSVFVAIVVGVDVDNYTREDKQCWISLDSLLNLVVIPCSIMLAFNLIVYVVVSFKVLCGRASIKQNSTRTSDVKRNILFSWTLFITLGGTWIFAFALFASEDDEKLELTFSYIFAVLNSLQGFFLFVMYIVRQGFLSTFIQIATSIVSTKSSDEITSSDVKSSNLRVVGPHSNSNAVEQPFQASVGDTEHETESKDDNKKCHQQLFHNKKYDRHRLKDINASSPDEEELTIKTEETMLDSETSDVTHQTSGASD